MGRGWVDVLAGFEAREPGVGFLRGEVEPRGVVALGGLQRLAAEALAGLLALYVLADCLAHDPVGRAVPGLGQRRDALAGLGGRA